MRDIVLATGHDPDGYPKMAWSLPVTVLIPIPMLGLVEDRDFSSPMRAREVTR